MGTLWFLLLYPSNNSIWWAGCNLGCDQVVSVPQSEALPRPSQKCCRLLQLARSLPVQPSPCRSVILTARNKCVSHTARCSLARLWPYLKRSLQQLVATVVRDGTPLSIQAEDGACKRHALVTSSTESFKSGLASYAQLHSGRLPHCASIPSRSARSQASATPAGHVCTPCPS